MKLVNYKCTKCKREAEELFQDSETPKDTLGKCSCGGELKKWNLKNNSQVWKWNDK